MSRQRRNFSAKFKSDLVIELLKGEKDLNTLATENNIQPNLLLNGNLFSYSYRDPNLENTRAAYCGMADFLEEFVQQGMPLDDMIIGTLNTIDPLLDPAGICDQECIRYLKGITPEDIARIRREILDTTNQELGGLVGVIREYIETGKFCAVGDVK